MKAYQLALAILIVVSPIVHAQEKPTSIRRTVSQGVLETAPTGLTRNYVIAIAGSLGKSDPVDVTLRGSSSKFSANLENPNRRVEVVLREDGETVNVAYLIGAQIPIKTGDSSVAYQDVSVTGSFLATLGEPFPILEAGDSKLTIQVDQLPSKK